MGDTTKALVGKNAFIAGGTSGINLGIAKTLAAAGARVAVLSRSQEKVDAAVAELNALSGADDCRGFAADVRDYDAVADALGQTAESFGPLDIVVSGAAGNFLAPAEQLSSNAFRTVVEIDLLGTFHVMRAAFDVARKPGATFINISAPQAAVPFWGQAHVCAAKAGVDMLTKTLAFEWGKLGINVNAIVPGPIENTEGMERLAATPQIRAAVELSVPKRSYGNIEDIANMALFLAGDGGQYINGAILCVDGGQILSGGALSHPDTIFQLKTPDDEATVS